MSRLTTKEPLPYRYGLFSDEERGSIGCPTSDEIYNKLKEYEDAEENGTLIKLPCKVRDKVYEIEEWVNRDICEGCEFYYEGGMGDLPECSKTPYGGRPPKCMTIDERIADKNFIFHCLEYDLFGVFVFLTREEAEAALKKMKDSEEELVELL